MLIDRFCALMKNSTSRKHAKIAIIDAKRARYVGFFSVPGNII
jgi:hypothetical protein